MEWKSLITYSSQCWSVLKWYIIICNAALFIGYHVPKLYNFKIVITPHIVKVTLTIKQSENITYCFYIFQWKISTHSWSNTCHLFLFLPSGFLVSILCYSFSCLLCKLMLLLNIWMSVCLNEWVFNLIISKINPLKSDTLSKAIK